MNKKQIQRALEKNYKTRLRFKKAITGSAKTFFQVYGAGSPRTLFGTLKEHDNALMALNAKGMNVAMAINAMQGERTSKAATKVNAIFVDDDSGSAELSTYLSLSFPPHLVVESSPGKLHPYWLLDGCATAEFGSVQLALASRFRTDTKVCDLARVMRMPGTFNCKYEEPYMSRLVHCETSRPPYQFDALVQGLELSVNADPTPLDPGLSRNVPAPGCNWAEIDAALAAIGPNDRHTWLVTGMALHTLDDRNRAYAAWTEWSRKSAKFDERDQQVTWAGFEVSGGVTMRTLFYMAKQEGWEGCAHDELSMAALFGETFRDIIRFDHKAKQWYRFGGVVWAADSQAPLQLFREFIAKLTETGESRKTASSRFRATASMRNVVAQAELLPSLHLSAHDFDRQPDLLAVKNGVVNLTDGSFRRATPSDLLSRQADVTYDPDAEAPTWRAFVKSIACGDLDFARFLQACAGYTMFGHTNEQIFFALIGSGANGKGVFSRTLKKLLGSYATVIAPNLMTAAYSGNPNSPTPALAKIAGARLLLCPESGAKAKLDDAFVKQLTGGDEITARTTYGDNFTFKPVGSLWLTTNHAPEIAHDDEAMGRRVVPLPFDAKFRGKDADVTLEEKLAAELAGIFNWFVRGAIAYGKSGLTRPMAVKRALRRMQLRADSVQWWLKEQCDVEADTQMGASEAYATYREFALDHSLMPLNIKQFSARLIDKGYEHRRRKQGVVYLGVRLK